MLTSTTINGGVLALYENDQHWQKFCFEQDERGNHRVVIVRTIGTSDDNNYEPITGLDYVYYKFSSDTKQIGCYFSRDGQKWILVRVHNNDYPARMYYGISSQCPKFGDEFTSEFSKISITQKAVKNFRMGE